MSHWLVSHLLSFSSVLYGSVQSKHMDCFGYWWPQFNSSSATLGVLTFIGSHCLESSLDRGTAGVLINALHQIYVSYVVCLPGGPSFPLSPLSVPSNACRRFIYRSAFDVSMDHTGGRVFVKLFQTTPTTCSSPFCTVVLSGDDSN